MATKIRWAAAIAIAGSAFIAAGCRTTEERPSGSSAPTARASQGDAGKSGRAGAMGAATTEQQSRSTEGDRTSAPTQSSSGDRGGTTAGEATPRGATTATSNELTGRVEKVDRSSIQVAGKTLKVDSSTSVKKGGVGAELTDVKEGDQVRASLTGSGDRLKAERIEVMSPAGAGTREPGKSSQQSGSTGGTTR